MVKSDDKIYERKNIETSCGFENAADISNDIVVCASVEFFGDFRHWIGFSSDRKYSHQRYSPDHRRVFDLEFQPDICRKILVLGTKQYNGIRT